MRSLDVFAATYGLGAGLGSNRAMSLLAYIASNLGMAGIVLFGSLMVSLLSMSRAVRRTSPARRVRCHLASSVGDGFSGPFPGALRIRR